MKNLRLERDNPRDIGFVHACVTTGVITFDELKEWIYYVIENYEEVPSYFFKILDLEDRRDYKSLEILGYVPHWEFDDSDIDALVGIGFKRKRTSSDDHLTREETLEALQRKPHIEKKFYEMFPFLKEKDDMKDL